MVFWFGSGFRFSFVVQFLPLPCLVLASVCSVGFFVWLAWQVKRVVSVALHNSVLGLASRVSAFTYISSGNAWPLLGSVF